MIKSFHGPHCPFYPLHLPLLLYLSTAVLAGRKTLRKPARRRAEMAYFVLALSKALHD